MCTYPSYLLSIIKKLIRKPLHFLSPFSISHLPPSLWPSHQNCRVDQDWRREVEEAEVWRVHFWVERERDATSSVSWCLSLPVFDCSQYASTEKGWEICDTQWHQVATHGRIGGDTWHPLIQKLHPTMSCIDIALWMFQLPTLSISIPTLPISTLSTCMVIDKVKDARKNLHQALWSVCLPSVYLTLHDSQHVT